MKILFCISSLGKGGAERVVSILANQLSNEHEVGIIVNTANDISYKLENVVKIIQLDEEKTKNPIIRNVKRIKKIKEILKSENPNIIISFLPVPSFRILFVNRKYKIPIIVSDRNNPRKEYGRVVYKLLMKWLYPKADGFVFQTNEQKEYFCKEIQKKSTIIFNPIKDSFLETNNIEIKERENIIVNVGRLVPQKNQKMLINAFSKVSLKHPQYKLKIFGDGLLKEELQKQINNLHINDKISLCGVIDDIKQELEKSKIFVLSSDYEGMPNALIEAMAVGCAAISTDCPCGGPRELIKDGENGMLIPIKDEKQLIESIDFLIENEEYSEQIGEKAKKIKEILKTDNILKQWKEYIQSIIEKGNY